MMRHDEAPAQPLRQHLPDRPANPLVPGLQAHSARDCGLADAERGGEAKDAGRLAGAVRGLLLGGVRNVTFYVQLDNSGLNDCTR